jgi:hypothetical protein
MNTLKHWIREVVPLGVRQTLYETMPAMSHVSRSLFLALDAPRSPTIHTAQVAAIRDTLLRQAFWN